MQNFVVTTSHDLRIVHQVPRPVGRLDVAVVVAAVAGEALVDENRVERVRHLVLLRAHKRLQIEMSRVLDKLVDLAAVEAAVVVESLELEGEHFGRLVDGEALSRRHFPLAVGAEVGVVAVQQLGRDELLQAARDRRQRLDVDGNVHEQIVGVEVAVALGALHLGTMVTAEDLVD